MRRLLVLLLTALLLAACATLGPPRVVLLQPQVLAADGTPAGTFLYLAGTRVEELLPGGKIRIPRGKLHGLQPTAKNLTVHPMRIPPGGTSRSLKTDFRLARADVIQLDERSAVLQLHHQGDPVEVGDYVEFELRAPEILRGDALFEVAAMDVMLRRLHDKTTLYELDELLRDPSPAKRTEVLERLTQEVRQHADLAKQVYDKRVEGGLFHGKQLHEAIAATTPETMARFVGFVRAFPGKYTATTWTLIDVYATWIINRTFDDRDFLLDRQIRPMLSQAELALERGDLALAEESWLAALKVKPHDQSIPKRVQVVQKIRHLQAKVAADPDDTKSRWDLLIAWWNESAYEPALEQLELLDKAKYRPDAVRKYRGLIAMRKKEWPACIEHLQAVDGKPDAGSLSLLVRYCTERRKIAESKADYATYMALGQLHEEEAVWGSAIARYQDALDAATTPAQLADAAAGQRRAAATRELDQDADTIDELIQAHKTKMAKDRWPEVAYGCGFSKNTQRCEAKYLERFAETARKQWEYELAEYYMVQWTKTAPDDAGAWRAYGWLQYETGQFDRAEQSVQHALELDPKSAYGHQILARIALALNKPDVAESMSRKAIELDADYAWPHESLARALAMQDKWQAALAELELARKILPSEGEIEGARNQLLIASDAAQLLAAKKNPPVQLMRIGRAFARMQLFAAADRYLAKLPAKSKEAQEVSRAIAQQETLRVDQDRLVRAAQQAGDTRLVWQALQRYLTAKRDYLQSKTPANRLALCRAYVEQARFAQALALCQATAVDGTAEADVVELARRGFEAEDRYQEAVQAVNRTDYALGLKLVREARAMMGPVNALRTLEMAWQEITALVWSGKEARQQAFVMIDLAIADAKQRAWPGTVRDFMQFKAWMESIVGKLGTREKAAQDSLAACLQEDNEYCQANLHMELASLAYEGGRLVQSIELAQRGLDLAHRVGDQNQILRAMGQLADQNFAASKLPEAEKLGRELLVQSRKALDDDNERFALMVLGAVAMKRGELETARKYFAEVYELGRRRGNNGARALARLFEGRAVLQLGRDAKAARPLLQQAAQLYEALDNDYDVCRTLIVLGMAEAELGEVDAARKTFDRASVIADRLDRPLMRASIKSELALLEVKAGQIKRALQLAQEAAKLTAKVDQGETRWTAQYALALASDKSMDEKAAFAAYEQAVQGVIGQLKGATGDSDRDGQLKFGHMREVMRDAIEFCLRTGRTDRALELLEMARDAELRRAFDPSRIKAQTAGLAKALDQVKAAEAEVAASKKALQEELSKPEEQQDQKRIEALGEVVAQTAGEQRKLLLRLRRDHGALIGHMSIDPQSVSDMRETLPPDAMFVQYFQTPDRLFIFVVSKTAQKTKVVSVPVSAKDMDEAVFAWRQSVQARNPTRSGKAAAGKPDKKKRAEAFDAEAAPADSEAMLALSQKLYQWLLQPIEADLQASKTAVLVPFGSLYYLPIHALATKGPDGKIQFAIEKFRLSYASSTTVFKMLIRERPERKSRTLLAFGNPDGSLPGARHEVEQVQQKSFPSARTFYEKDATKQRFFELAGQYQIIHFATHGILSEDPLASHLKMANEPLTVEEIGGFEGMEGKTDLVVLSACETALQVAKASMGQELTSLATAFGYAGAPALIASLWEVDDEATAELMTEFYRILHTQPSIDTLEALRQAQIHVLHLTRDGVRPFADPAYWAAFQLIGDYR